jgi:glucuronoarabinoxylan endo-1,4-beta-xylanase
MLRNPTTRLRQSVLSRWTSGLERWRQRMACLPLAMLVAAAATGCGGGGNAGDGPSAARLSTSAQASAGESATATTIAKVTWPRPAAIDWGTALSTAQLNASSDVAGTFVYTPAAGTKLEVGVQSLSVTFTPQDQTKYSPNTVVRKLTVNKASAPVRWDFPSPVLQGSALTAAQISTAPYALYGIQGTADPASYQTVDGKPLGTATTADAGTAILQATFVPRDGAHYRSSKVSTVLTVQPAIAAAAIDFGDAKQAIRGFGGAAAWYYEKMSDERLNVLFGTSLPDSLGLDIIRLRIAPADWNASTQTADTSQWTAELQNGAAVQARGGLVFASPWTPPASMKIVNADRQSPLYSGRLDPSKYADYAQYLNSYIRYAASRNVSLYAVSLQNEPDWDPQTYESCLWSAEEMKAWAGGYGATAVSGTATKLMAPESFFYSQATLNTLLGDPKAAANISIVGGHLYGAVPDYSSPAMKRGKEVWMTEHFLDSVNKSASTWQTSIDDAIAMAKEIHDGLTLAQYNAYVYWWLVNSNDATPAGLISTTNKPTYFGIGMKHFSYFVRPGYVRYDATSMPQKGVRMSAFSSPAGAPESKVVIVLVNENAVDIPLKTSIDSAGRTLTSLTPYRTTASATFERQPAVAVSANAFSISLPAKSITTLVN